MLKTTSSTKWYQKNDSIFAVEHQAATISCASAVRATGATQKDLRVTSIYSTHDQKHFSSNMGEKNELKAF